MLQCNSLIYIFFSGTHFCWVCNGPFDHKTYSHACGRFKEDSKTGTDDARTSLKRYLHYYERFKVHEDSRKKEKSTRKNINDKIADLYSMKPNSAWTEVQWLENGMETLFQARRALQYSYVFGTQHSSI